MNPEVASRWRKPIMLVLALAASIGGGQNVLSINLSPVAVLPRQLGGPLPCADARHSGHYAVYGTVGPNCDSTLIFENVGKNTYREIQGVAGIGSVLDCGFANGDSLCDLLLGHVGYPDNDSLYVLQSLTSDTYPTQLTWAGWPPTYYCPYWGRFADLDGDGRDEIVLNDRWYPCVFENQGDNRYVEAAIPQSPRVVDCLATGDLDQNGRQEIEECGEGILTLIECVGRGQYVVAYSAFVGSSNLSTFDCAMTNDMDGDGLPKLVSFADLGGVNMLASVFEEPLHDRIQCVWQTVLPSAWPGNLTVAAGDVDGDGADEFAVSNGIDVRLFKATGRHQYEQVWSYPQPLSLSGALRFFDLNRDGRDQLIIGTDSSEIIFEDTVGLGIAENPRPNAAAHVQVLPTIMRPGMKAAFSGLPTGACVEVYDAGGRLVRHREVGAATTWQWDGRDDAGQFAPAGAYAAVVRSGGRSYRLKLDLVK